MARSDIDDHGFSLLHRKSGRDANEVKHSVNCTWPLSDDTHGLINKIVKIGSISEEH